MGRDREIRNYAMRQQLKALRVRPACLACGEPINLRNQRQGYLHTECETKTSEAPQGHTDSSR